MLLTPSSTISLYAGVEIDNDEQLVFKTKANQTAYFTSKLVISETPCTMLRKTGRVRITANAATVATCNYLSFVNPNFDNKIIYARIIDYDFVNNGDNKGCTIDILYAIDYWQTWLFDVQFEDCYIEREHLSQEDFAKSNANPYDPTIFEFRTNENLPISKDLEKLSYSIGSDDTYDGYKMTAALSNVVQAGSTIGTLIKISNIDLEDLESTEPGIADHFAKVLFQIATQQSLGYFYLTSDMGVYLQQNYGNTYYATGFTFNNYTVGSGWKTVDNEDIFPFWASRFQPSCCYIYDMYGGDFTHGNGKVPDLIKALTEMSAVDSLIDIRAIPNNMMILSGRGSQSGDPITYGQRTVKTKINVVNKKLMWYPYSYMRLIAPNGDVRELQFERFANVQQGEDICYMSTSLDIVDQPTLMIAPNQYKANFSSNRNSNILEGLYFNQFPTMPFTIDAFTAAVAANAVNEISNRTTDEAYDLAASQTKTNKVSEWLNTAAMSIMPKVGEDEKTGDWGIRNGIGELLMSAASTAASAYEFGSSLFSSRGHAELAAQRWNEADTALGGMPGNVIAQQMELTRPAYACDKYYPSNGLGVVNFNYLSFEDIVVLRVTLSPEILAIYDKWFSMYGYNSGRCGIPRVINYARNGSQTSELPAWTVLNGKNTTYIKTMDCKIIYANLSVASAIKQMFDKGVRFIQGDSNA